MSKINGVKTMNYEIKDASPKAKFKIAEGAEGVARAVDDSTPHHLAKYPFDALAVGQCFTVPIGEANEMSLRMLSSQRGKKVGKKFTVIKHYEYACIEVARIA